MFWFGYRRDRRNLLEFLFSSGLIKELRTPAGPITALSDLDFDNLSADYVLHSIKSGQFFNSSYSPFGSRENKKQNLCFLNSDLFNNQYWLCSSLGLKYTMNSTSLSFIQSSSVAFVYFIFSRQPNRVWNCEKKKSCLVQLRNSFVNYYFLFLGDQTECMLIFRCEFWFSMFKLLLYCY